jgi:hypothetical protein
MISHIALRVKNKQERRQLIKIFGELIANLEFAIGTKINSGKTGANPKQTGVSDISPTRSDYEGLVICTVIDKCRNLDKGDQICIMKCITIRFQEDISILKEVDTLENSEKFYWKQMLYEIKNQGIQNAATCVICHQTIVKEHFNRSSFISFYCEHNFHKSCLKGLLKKTLEIEIKKIMDGTNPLPPLVPQKSNFLAENASLHSSQVQDKHSLLADQSTQETLDNQVDSQFENMRLFCPVCTGSD